jgi:hypothetical protein
MAWRAEIYFRESTLLAAKGRIKGSRIKERDQVGGYY